MTSINKALKILDLYLYNRKAIGISEVANSVGMSMATVHRIIHTLVERGYLEQLSPRGKYYFNKQKILSISKILLPNLSIINIIWPYLRELSKELQECAEVATRLGDVAYKDDYLYTKFEPLQALTVSGPSESIVSLYCTVTGKVLLAYMTDYELQEYLKNVELKPFTPNTIINPENLKEQLKIIRDKGVAFDNEEYEMGIIGVAVPITDAAGPVASIGIIAPTARYDHNKLNEFSVVLKEYALKISNYLRTGNRLL